MKATAIKYEKVFNLGNYENERIGIELALEDGDTAADALAEAKRWTKKQSTNNDETANLRYARKVLESPDEYTGKQVRDAEELLARFEAEDKEFAF